MKSRILENSRQEPNFLTYWCLGLYASASTWLFNIVRQLSMCGNDNLVQTHFLSGPCSFSSFDRPSITNIVKSHEISDEATILELSKRSQKIFITLRDPRDAVTSLMLYHGYDFDRALTHVHEASLLCVRFSEDNRSIILNYETSFFDDLATLALVSEHLGFDIPAHDMLKIFQSSLRSEVEKHISGMSRLPGILQDNVSGDMLDPTTHWHTHHAGRSGEIGRWRHMLTPEQADEITSRLSDCFSLG